MDGLMLVFLGVLLLISAIAGIGVDTARARARGARVRVRSYVISAIGLVLAIACFVVGASS